MVELQVDDRTSQSAPVSPRLGSKSTFRSQNGHGFDAPGRATYAQQQRTRNFHPDASLVLVGVRGSGKRSLGLIAATALGRRFITEDWAFQSISGFSRQDYLKIHGSEEFHKQDVLVTRKMLEDNRHKCVIDCGLGSLTSSLQEFLREYSVQNPVIYLIRDMEQIQSLLNLGERSARLLEAGDPSHRKCSNYEYYNLQEPSSLALHDADAADRTSSTYSFRLRHAQEDFSQFVRLVTGGPDRPDAVSPFSVEAPVQTRAFTHALELPLSLAGGAISFDDLNAAGDVVEVIVDQWGHGAAKAVSKLVAMARRHIKVPVIYSVKLPNVQPDSQLAILNHGFRLGVEYLSVDLQMGIDILKTVCAMKGKTKIIGTYNREYSNVLGWKDPYIKTMFEKALSLRCDISRFRFPSLSMEDLGAMSWFREDMKILNSTSIPIVAYNTGASGRTSRILNTTLTPVTHESLLASNPERTSASLTAKNITNALFSCFVLSPLKFCIIGGNVTESLSPAMHNAAYEHLGLQHAYTTRNIKSWTDIEALAKDDHFGGASIVQPWKVKITEKVASLSHHGKAIGAVNTLIPLRAAPDGRPLSLHAQAFNRNRAGPVVAWHAENTDWLGIRVCISRSLSPRNVIQSRTTGLVIGAGGMARAAVYALLQMGCRNVFIYNRTVSHGHLVADHFNKWLKTQISPQPSVGEAVKVLESLEHPWPEHFSLPTMIVSCVTHEVLDGNPGADFEMPRQWLESPSGGVALEMAYMTKETALIRQVKQFRQMTGLPWVIVDGIETLIEQAIGQFEIMTGRKAPRKVMTAAIRAVLRENRQYVADGEEYNTQDF